MSAQRYRWSGVAGIAGSVLFIGVFLFVGLVVGADASIEAFPGIRLGRTVENALYLAALVLWVVAFLGLGRALRDTNPRASLSSSVLAIVGVGVLAAGALPHVAAVPLADAFHAPGATEAERVALSAVWDGNQAILTMLLVTGLAIVPIGVIGLGVAMLDAPGFGRSIGWAGVGVGIVGLVVAAVLLADPASPVAAIGFFALIGFQFAAGWRLVAVSRDSRADAALASPAAGVG
jgi:hypothetical protein